MHKDNNICFNCRRVYKSNWICPECGRYLIHISHKWRVPKKTDVKQWETFKNMVCHSNSYVKSQYEDIYCK